MLSSVSIKVQLEEEVVVYSSPYLEKMNEVLPKHSVRSAYSCDCASAMRRGPQQLTTANVSFQNYAELPHVAAHHRQGQQLESPFQRRQSPLQEGNAYRGPALVSVSLLHHQQLVSSDSLWDHGGGRLVAGMRSLRPEQHGECSWSSVCA